MSRNINSRCFFSLGWTAFLFLFYAALAHATGPSVPASITAVAVTPIQVNLSWAISTATGTNTIVGYNIYRNGVMIAPTGPDGPVSGQTYTVAQLSPSNYTNNSFFSDYLLTPNTTYAYKVAAVDSAGNISAKSAASTVTTLPAFTVPSAPHIAPFYTCATNYYVSATSGSDSTGNGSSGSPWATISKAAAVLNAQGGSQGGVCVNVAPGTYQESVDLGSLSGSSDTPTGYFVLRSTTPQAAIIENPPNPNNNSIDYVNGILISSGSYVVIDGFTLNGFANNQPLNNIDAVGINSQSSSNATCTCHHIRIYNNLVYGWGGSGIAAQHTDYEDWEGNVVYDCCRYSQYQESGIDPWEPVAWDLKTWSSTTVASGSSSYHYIIRDNIAFQNTAINLLSSAHTDGCGIELDTFSGDGTNPNGTLSTGNPPFAPPSLVENNLSFYNGGSGIETGGSGCCDITVRNNTCYHNWLDNFSTMNVRGEISLISWIICKNDSLINNLASADPTANPDNLAIFDAGFVTENTNNTWANNLAYEGTAGLTATSFPSGETTDTFSTANNNILASDPLINNSASGDFTLQAASPAVNAGTTTYGIPILDLAGNSPRTNGTINLGAYEYLVAPSAITSPTAAFTATTLFFNYQITANNFPTSYNATGLPSGLTVNPTTGVISGNPTELGSYVVTLSASNGAGTISRTLYLTVNSSIDSPTVPVWGLIVLAGLLTWIATRRREVLE